jgi:hypothetical protein
MSSIGASSSGVPDIDILPFFIMTGCKNSISSNASA